MKRITNDIHHKLSSVKRMRSGIVAALAATALLASGCMKDLLETVPPTQVLSGNAWTTDNLTDLGVNGVYAALRQGRGTGGTTNREIYQYDRLATMMYRDNDALLTGSATTGSGLFSSVWQELFESIHRANDAIYGITHISPSSDEKKARLLAETKFLRAFFYYRLNQLYRGVPIYLEPIAYDEATLPRNSEQEVWEQVLADLTESINEPNLPNKYNAGDSNFGRATKSAAYALRGKTFMYLNQWEEAIADFAQVKALGHNLFMGDYASLFTEANEQSDEMIFSIQNIPVSGYGSTFQFYYGSRSAFGSNWNTYLVHPDVVDLYENLDGSTFHWDDYLPGYNAMEPAKREVFFLRNGLTETEIANMNAKGLDMSLYLPDGNEERIEAAYDARDPRLNANVIVPYSTFNGTLNGADETFTMRWPYRTDLAPTYDIRTDMIGLFYYLPRKFVYEGTNPGIPDRVSGGTDAPLIRYADILLSWAEALNELNRPAEAITLVNEVRDRAGVGLLNASATTAVGGQDDLRERIRNERRKEFLGEGVAFFDELRWKTWEETTFYDGNGRKFVWGQVHAPYTWAGEQLYTWPIPRVEIERNPTLTQNPHWVD